MILTIDRIGHLGDGVATGEGGPIYIPQTLPGEVVGQPRETALRPCPHLRRLHDAARR
jgi:tRNA/tmRNA/rRNA uracil-C5-methylase (TrmA/RlmC/RlmD family)